MNKLCYRTVFNRQRGMRMAVAETSPTHAGQGAAAGQGPLAPVLRQLTMLALLGGLHAVTATAQVVADTTASGNQRPAVLTTASGVTQVNIQTPSAAGVSRNTYSQFDVNGQGAILNNSRSNTSTQIGGFVQANPWLANGSARVILNEVNSTRASRIHGFVEVAGPSAEVIIANPAGIAIDGGGFINASAVTLTTGSAVMNAGNLESFRVRGGAVSVHGAGLDTSGADHTHILARAVQINAGIWASQLTVLTGSNDLSAIAGSAPVATGPTHSAADSAAPSFALDVAELGGMYARSIFIMGTEAGLGVRNSGVVGATAGDVQVTNNGALVNSGSIYAGSNTHIATQGEIINSGQGLIAALGNTNLSAQGRISAVAGTTLAAGMNSAGTVGQSGTLSVVSATTADLHGNVAAGQASNVSAAQLSLRGATLHSGSASLLATGQEIDATGASITVHDTLNAQAQTGLVTDRATVHAAQLVLAAHSLSNVGGDLQHSSDADFVIAVSGDVDNRLGSIASNAHNLTISAASLENTAGTIRHLGSGTLAFDTGGTLTNDAGTVFAAGDLSVHATDLSNASTTAQASMYAQGNTTVALSGALRNLGTQEHTATIAALGNTSIHARSVVGNADSLVAAGVHANGALRDGTSAGNLLISTSGSIDTRGQTFAAQALVLEGASLDLSNGQIGGANVDLTAHSGDIVTRSATLVTPGTLRLQAQTHGQQHWDNNSASGTDNSSVRSTDTATIQAGQLAVSVANLSNEGGRIVQTGSAATHIALSAAQGVLNNSAGTIATNAIDLALEAFTLVNTGGTISHAGTGTLTIDAGTFSGRGGHVVGNGALVVSASGALDLHGATTHAQHVNITAASLDNRDASIVQSSSTRAAARLAVSGALDNAGGVIASNSGLQIGAGSVTNANGHISALESLQITSTGTVRNDAASAGPIASSNAHAGRIQSNGSLSVQAASLDNTGATLASAHSSVSINAAGQLANTTGRITAAGDLDLGGASLRNDLAGQIGAGGDITIQSDNVDNSGGQVVATGHVVLRGHSGAARPVTVLNNAEGLVQSGATLHVHASHINNTGTYTAPSNTSSNTSSGTPNNTATALGLVADNVVLTTHTLNNQGGEVLASTDLTVQAVHSINNSESGLLYAGNALLVQDSASQSNPEMARNLQIDNAGGVIRAVSSSHIEAAGLTGNGQLLSQGDLSLDIEGDFNHTGTVNANRNVTLSSAATVTNSGTLSAGHTLRVHALHLDNEAGGTLSSGTLTNVQLTGTLTNRGRVDSGNSDGTSLTHLQATTIDNLGHGRVYGDRVSIAADSLHNRAETASGVTRAAVIASRGDLDLGVHTLNNSGGATLLSLDNMAIGGALDASQRATGRANTVTNSASQIQSVNGNVAITTATLNNLNPEFSYTVVDGPMSAPRTEYILTNGQTVQATAVAVTNGMLSGYTIAGGFTEPYGRVLLASHPLATATNIAVYQSNDVVTETNIAVHPFNDVVTETTFSEPSDPRMWALLGVTPPSDANDTAPYYALQSQIDTVRAQLNASMHTVQSYNEYTSSSQRAVTRAGTPGTISSAGDTTINASNGARNDNSRIVAGRALHITGGELHNTSTPVTVNAHDTGYNFNWYCVNFVGTSYCGVAYYNQFNLAGQPALRQNPFSRSTATTVQVSGSQAQEYSSVSTPSGVAAPATQTIAVASTSVAGQASGAATPAIAAAPGGSASATDSSATLLSRSAVTQAHAGGPVPRTGGGDINLPASSLFHINSSPSAQYVVQTDPAFTNYRTWLGSDYITAQMALDPSVTQKRLGDGFYEQQLIRELAAALENQIQLYRLAVYSSHWGARWETWPRCWLRTWVKWRRWPAMLPPL